MNERPSNPAVSHTSPLRRAIVSAVLILLVPAIAVFNEPVIGQLRWSVVRPE